MALAKKFNRTVTEIVPATTKVIEVPHIELNLTMEEAQTLFDICSRVGGSMVNSPREHADAIYAALKEQGAGIPELPTKIASAYILYKDTES